MWRHIFFLSASVWLCFFFEREKRGAHHPARSAARCFLPLFVSIFGARPPQRRSRLSHAAISSAAHARAGAVAFETGVEPCQANENEMWHQQPRPLLRARLLPGAGSSYRPWLNRAQPPYHKGLICLALQFATGTVYLDGIVTRNRLFWHFSEMKPLTCLASVQPAGFSDERPPCAVVQIMC